MTTYTVPRGWDVIDTASDMPPLAVEWLPVVTERVHGLPRVETRITEPLYWVTFARWGTARVPMTLAEAREFSPDIPDVRRWGVLVHGGCPGIVEMVPFIGDRNAYPAPAASVGVL